MDRLSLKLLFDLLSVTLYHYGPNSQINNDKKYFKKYIKSSLKTRK